MQIHSHSTHTAIDPVCNMTVDSRTAVIESTYEGRTYYFCNEGCRKAFEECPRKYLEPQTKKKKGCWGRYLERLEKATGGRPMKCH